MLTLAQESKAIATCAYYRAMQRVEEDIELDVELLLTSAPKNSNETEFERIA